MIRNDYDWRAEDDAHILERAEEIKTDKLRYDKAINMAKKLVKTKEESLSALKKLTKKGNTLNTSNNKGSYNQSVFENSIVSARR